jgi:hypothetical protein
MAWSYKREEQSFQPIPEGAHRIRIKSAEKAMSKNGNDMLTLQFEVSGSSQLLYHYIVFLDDRPEITNRMLTQFFDSFAGIPEGDFDMRKWIGKVGACRVKHEEYNGNMRARITSFITADKQDDLPPWKEANGAVVDKDGFVKVGDEELPDFE